MNTIIQTSQALHEIETQVFNTTLLTRLIAKV
jgi:hypothetical protein